MRDGLSPRGRGNLRSSRHAVARDRSIPAWAGEPGSPITGQSRKRVYPRVGGGTFTPQQWIAESRGLSPRGRGNLPSCQPRTGRQGSIPAWAGEPICHTFAPFQPEVYPRVGGGTRIGINTVTNGYGLSPRGRGNPPDREGNGQILGSIPAWAGEPSAPSIRAAMSAVYPRVGGGTRFTLLVRPAIKGLSPRGRGNQW